MNVKEPKTVTRIAELREAVGEFRRSSRRIGLVPTMGALHDGHMSLVRKCRQQCDVTIVSIFVNPTQFAAGEDLGDYPRPLQQDLALLQQEGADVVFVPETGEVYPPGCSTTVQAPKIARKMEGESRPTHFDGVATVVLKLFQMAQPDVAFFGQKDYQQSLVVRHMVRDLNLPVEIVVCPIVREPDGLALSSRNRYLDEDERKTAIALNRTLREAAELILQGERDGRVIMATMTQMLIEGGVTETDYAVVVDAETLDVQETVAFPVALLVAARVGKTRLIDNMVIPAEPDQDSCVRHYF